MAATMATAAITTTVAGLATSSLSSPKRTNLTSGTPLSSTLFATSLNPHFFSLNYTFFYSAGFIKSRVAARNPLKQSNASGGRFTCFERDWLRKDLSVIGFGLIGWLAPSSIPLINGNSLTGLFFGSIGEELSHFPTPPAIGSQFWLWLVTWHFGLFLCLTFGQIGFKGRTESYF
ncbi:hypothetical protein IFM89_008045 [Coptis chinensis]|uniref:Photosystem I subunit O n=1 Tax=Coptis chinensis TaxID=261450 RepID=A0A835LYZ4_9MAGN|nr:hypothetical protein IFM89_008045 [Coptis chinensis]